MLDSINFIVYGIGELDTRRIVGLGITYHRFQYRKNSYGKYYRVYRKVTNENDPYLVSRGIEFEYNKILFQFYEKFNCIVLVANAHKVMQKTDILLSDRDKYIDMVKQAVVEALNVDYFRLNLHRIDYCVDLKLDYKVMYKYLDLLDKHRTSYQHIIRINDYETSIYLTSKSGQKRINIYDKYKQMKDKYLKEYEEEYQRTGIDLTSYKIKHFPYYEYYQNIFRIEVQNTKKLIQSECVKIINKYDNRRDIQKEIDKLLKELNNLGYKRARKCKLDREMERRANMSIYDNLDIKYPKDLRDININDLDMETMVVELMIEDLVEQEEQKICKSVEMDFKDKLVLNRDLCAYWNKASMDKYYFEFLKDFLYMGTYYKLKTAKQMVKKSDYSECDKQHLKEFLEYVNKYGISGVTTSNKKNKHQMWCGATVERYIKELESLGINLLKVAGKPKYNLKAEIETINKSEHTENWKAKLILFIKALKKYDLANITATDNEEIARNNEKHNHKTWSNVTVNNYIEMLSKIGINPVTLDNNCEFDSLESLYLLIQKKAQAEYFDITDKELAPPPEKVQKSIISRRLNTEF